MKHSHPAGWTPPDSYAFAESIVREGGPWLRQETQRLERGQAIVEFSSTKAIEGAVLFSTSESGFTGQRNWIETPATVAQRGGRVRIAAPLPGGSVRGLSTSAQAILPAVPIFWIDDSGYGGV